MTTLGSEHTVPGSTYASDLPGPFSVGAYAAALKRQLREFQHVQLVGEVWGLRPGRARVYFELRDSRGALPCSLWRNDFDALGLALTDGMRIVVGGGCDYYPGSATSSPAFTFAVGELRIEGEGDLLVQLQRLRRRLAADGLFEPQKRLARPSLPRTIGVVTGESGKARDDVLAGLHRRGWAGRLVWAFAPVQDRRAAPRIAAALRELAATPEVEVVIVARGGGSLADLFAFCDEALCRTVALLRVPVIASVGHHTDRTLIDDVAAVCCSTPTHAAEAAVPVDCRAARVAATVHARRLRAHSRRAILERARALAHLSRAPIETVVRHRQRLHQLLRELRASARRAGEHGRELAGVHLLVLGRTAVRARSPDAAKRRRELERLALGLAAHDPERTLARGYALVQDGAGEPLPSAAAARRAGDLRLRFRDGSVPARVLEPHP
ncbi:MAG: exodeoxyribonuclease VII large subunit [Solirubrobacterales bacterium]|nr:MAG: exodeoxyribonuclease VII large subunit [Solirubrobacterales bacterium]